MTIAENLQRIQSEISEAAGRAGRDASDVRIIGVTKTVDRRAVDLAYAAGLRDFGENRVQDAARKFEEPLPADARLHLIGHLQSNKARDAVTLFHTIHSIDRESVISGLQRRALAADRVVDVLLQVNIANEDQKHGCDPQDAARLLDQIVAQSHLRVVGLMTIAPLVAAAESTRPVFNGLRQLRESLQQQYPDLSLNELSMGMTNDFVVAVEEGATMVRIGRAIFADQQGNERSRFF